MFGKIKELSTALIIKKVFRDLEDDSNENMLRIAKRFEKLSPKSYQSVIKNIEQMIKDNLPAVQFLRRIFKEIHPNCRDKFIENMVINGMILNQSKRNNVEKKGSFTPFSVLISPTMRCNLDCIGCYAANYNKKDDMTYELFDSIITQAEEMGTAIFTILGGEPLVAKEELFKICRNHKKSFFQFFTNGTLITEDVAKELVNLGNLMPVVSIEGSIRETDFRRGKGVYNKVMKAMDILKKYKIPFGYSCTVSRKNAEVISSDKFLDQMIDKGAFIGWYFLYMPMGENPKLDLMPTPKQRKELMERWKIVRGTKPMFVIDFWNDAPTVGGCIAGKAYVHINSNGDVEPCIFTHFAVDNIKKKPLFEIMRSGFFKEMRSMQPFNKNLYMPCMWIDNPEVGRKLCKKHGCYPTHPGADTIIKDEKVKKALDKYSKEVKKEFDPVWEKDKVWNSKSKKDSKNSGPCVG